MTKIMSKVPFIILIAMLISFGMGGCKSQKKLAREQAAAEYAQKVEQARKNLTAIINDEGNMTTDEKEALLNKTKAMNLNEPEILSMIREAEDIIASERAEEERLRKEAEAAKKAVLSTTAQLDKYFREIANAGTVDYANQKITEALKLFASPQTPVLIIISTSGGIIDYDRPTTIIKYLNYLKDQKKSINAIENLQEDDNGKIVELELIKK